MGYIQGLEFISWGSLGFTERVFSFLIVGVVLKSTVLTFLRGGTRAESLLGDSLFLAGGLLGQKNSLDVGQDTTLGDGDTGEELVQLFVVPHGELEMTRDNPGLLVVSGGVTGQLEDLGCQVFHDSCEVDWSTSTYTLGIVALAQKTVNTSNGELQTRTG